MPNWNLFSSLQGEFNEREHLDLALSARKWFLLFRAQIIFQKFLHSCHKLQNGSGVSRFFISSVRTHVVLLLLHFAVHEIKTLHSRNARGQYGLPQAFSDWCLFYEKRVASRCNFNSFFQGLNNAMAMASSLFVCCRFRWQKFWEKRRRV